MKQVYLDYAAATPIDREVVQAMQAAMADFTNPASPYTSGRNARKELQNARKKLAMFLGANLDEIIFTSGASESNNLAILGTARTKVKGEIISVQTEHSSIREPLSQLENEGYKVKWCEVDKNGRINESQFAKLLTKKTIMVSISLANSEYGTIEDISRLSRIVHQFNEQEKCNILFHTDASAAALVQNCTISRLGVDLLTLSSAKVYGPTGIGLLYVRRGTEIQPLIYGGNQESGLRAGTESVFLAVGFAKAVELIQKYQKKDDEHFRELYTQLSKYFEQKGIQLNGDQKKRLYSILNVSFNNLNGEDLVAYLDIQGFEVSTGAACEVSNQLPSKALLSLGLSKKYAQGSLRISFGRTTTKSDLSAFTKALDATLTILEQKK